MNAKTLSEKSLNVLVVGGGGREHALAWRLMRSPSVASVAAAPGNPGMAGDGVTLWPESAAAPWTDLIERAAREAVDLVVVGPEDPLVGGLADRLRARGIAVFGPGADGARIEGSKAWAKDVMRAAGIPTADSWTFGALAPALAHLDAHPAPWVIKADGLAAGKGVTVTSDRAAAVKALEEIFVDRRFGAAGDEVLFESFLTGYEVSVLALTDGHDVFALPASQDHKRAYDRDEGPNTGGMGVYAPVPPVTETHLRAVRERVLLPLLAEFRKRGIDYRGCLYAGLMIDGEDVRVVEFNCRFGDPETECVLPLVEGDFAAALKSCADGALDKNLLTVASKASCTVILASGGYPGDYEKGKPIEGLGTLREAKAFHAGTAAKDGRVVTAGGRVLALTATGADLHEAIAKAYADVNRVCFDGIQYRSDIGRKGLSTGG